MNDFAVQAEKRKKALEMPLDPIRGCLFGGAVGDALGYAVEFMSDEAIFAAYGRRGITEYRLDRESGKALISDDTQMTLFTANGLLVNDTRSFLTGSRSQLRMDAAHAYQDWLFTQQHVFGRERKGEPFASWLCDVPELYARRAPGNTCLDELEAARHSKQVEDYIKNPVNHSKGCGGVMRVAPVGLNNRMKIKALDWEGAQLAAITHGHSLGYMPAAVLVHIINRIVFPEKHGMSLKEIVIEAKEAAKEMFEGDAHLQELTERIDRAVAFSENEEDDLDNIRLLGKGWVAEEALAIAIYCSLKYADDFSEGVIAAVNHSGDSDSTGAITGNILGALAGYKAIDEKWKQNLECSDVILEMADDLCCGCSMNEGGLYEDERWMRKYVRMRWKAQDGQVR